MSKFQLKTPVAFIIFNRPDTTELVFAAIAKAKPPKLLVIGDGPRADRAGEVERVSATRAIIERVDWQCDVLTNFSEINLGCKNRVSSGIDWVFQKVEEAIILEDDCLPDPTFFQFCEELLVHYRDDERIAMISGDNFQFGRKRSDASYYFSRYNHIWGWATWRRAWEHYDREVAIWPIVRDEGILNLLINHSDERKFWNTVFQSVHEGNIDTWDYQWILASWSQGMISVMPNVNLISNIGFGVDATHTHSDHEYSKMPTEPMTFPLVHMDIFLPCLNADNFTARYSFTNSFVKKVIRKIRFITKKFIKNLGTTKNYS